jgi:dTDP-4-dehydrorhamnose reductase
MTAGPRRILITGAGGMLGGRLAALLAGSASLPFARPAVTALNRRDLDTTCPGMVRAAIRGLRPDLVIHCAAATAVDECTLRPQWAALHNAAAPGIVARECRAVGARMVLISTDFVFSGDPADGPGAPHRPYRPGDLTGPISVYGRTKLDGEFAAREAGGRLLIVRTGWTFGSPRAFLARMLGAGRQAGAIRAVTDQVGSPTYVADLAAALLELIAVGAEGLFHVVDAGQASREQLLREAVAIVGEPVAVVPAATADFPAPARRPAYSALCTAAYTAATGRRMRPWQEAVADYLRAEFA